MDKFDHLKPTRPKGGSRQNPSKKSSDEARKVHRMVVTKIASRPYQRPHARPAQVISMIDRLNRPAVGSQEQVRQKAAPQMPMRPGYNDNIAYEKLKARKRALRLMKLRGDAISFLVAIMLLFTSGYITYQVTSAWFTNRPITFQTLMEPAWLKKDQKDQLKVKSHKKAKKSDAHKGSSTPRTHL
jgi:hypothetical protein